MCEKKESSTHYHGLFVQFSSVGLLEASKLRLCVQNMDNPLLTTNDIYHQLTLAVTRTLI